VSLYERFFVFSQSAKIKKNDKISQNILQFKNDIVPLSQEKENRR